jgi:hypothetical protein
MARHVFSVLCRRSITDQGSNLLSIVDILDGIAAAPAQPEDVLTKDGQVALAFDASFVSQFTRSELDKGEEFEVRVLLTGPGGEKLGETGAHIDLTKFQNFRMATKFERLPLVGPGRYEFKVQLQEGKRWRTVAAVPLAVTIQAGATAPTTS